MARRVGIWRRVEHILVGLAFHDEIAGETAFRARERAIHRALGPDVRIETWDRGWARVWEPIELATLDQAFLERIGARIASYVTTLEPLLRAELPSDVEWSEPRARR